MSKVLLEWAMLGSLLVGCWFQYDEMRSGAADFKLETIRSARSPGYFLIHFGTGTGFFDQWIDQIAAGVPGDAELMYSCSSVRKCDLAIGRLPERVDWIAYDLEGWDHSEGDQDDIRASVMAAAELAHSHGKLLMFIPCSKLLFDENHHLIPLLAPLVDGWIVQGQWFQLTERDFVADATAYYDLIRQGDAEIPVLIQLRMNRFNWKGNVGWDPYFPPETHTAEGLYEHYWLPLADRYDGVLLADYADDNNPDPEQRRPWGYWRFVMQERQEVFINPPLIGGVQ